jgi:hypothetical protein
MELPAFKNANKIRSRQPVASPLHAWLHGGQSRRRKTRKRKSEDMAEEIAEPAKRGLLLLKKAIVIFERRSVITTGIFCALKI